MKAKNNITLTFIQYPNKQSNQIQKYLKNMDQFTKQKTIYLNNIR